MSTSDRSSTPSRAELFTAEADAFAAALAPHHDPPGIIGLSLVRAAALFTQGAEAALLPHGLTWTRFSALFIVGAKSPIALKELQRHLGLSRQATHTAITELERAEALVVSRGATEDRRERRIELTASGARLLRAAFADHLEFVERWMAPVPPGERDRLDAMLRGLVGQGAANAAASAANPST